MGRLPQNDTVYGKIHHLLYDYFSRFLDMCCILILSSLVIVVFLNVCFRYFLNLPLAWSSELARILLVWVTFIGGAAAITRSRHLKISDIINRVPPEKRKILLILINILVSVFLVIMIWKGIEMSLHEKEQVTDAFQISMMVFYGAIPIGCLFMLPYSLFGIISIVKEGGTK